MSQEGTQQRRTRLVNCYSATLSTLLMVLDSVFRLGYMDDVTLGGFLNVFARYVHAIDVGHEMGLDLNVSKYELISHPGCVESDSTLQSFLQIPEPDAELVRAPLFSGNVLDTVWSQRCNDLARAVDRLKSISLQDALILLRASFSAPRVQHLFCCSPTTNNAALQTFDKHLRVDVTSITNSDLIDIQ